jgi:hypothetical protein
LRGSALWMEERVASANADASFRYCGLV